MRSIYAPIILLLLNPGAVDLVQIEDGAEVKGDLNAQLCQMLHQLSELKVNISDAIIRINNTKEQIKEEIGKGNKPFIVDRVTTAMIVDVLADLVIVVVAAIMWKK